jgi:maltose/moltooligosaccharide transporter
MFHYSFSVSFVGTTGKLPTWVLPRFFSVQFVPSDLFGGVLIRNPPTEEELKKIKKKEPLGLLHLLIYFRQLRHAKVMWASIGLFVSMVCLVLLLAKLIKSIALSVWNTTQKMKLYVEAVSWTGLVNGWYNIVTFLCAFVGLFC